MYLLGMSSNERTSERRKVRHSERLQFKKDNELYQEAIINPDTVKGQSTVDLNTVDIIEKKNISLFKRLYDTILKKKMIILN
jgi:hypothetical protein